MQVGYDKNQDPQRQNICTTEGLLTALCWLRRLKPQGLAWLATECSTWVWISRATTLRTAGKSCYLYLSKVSS